MATVSDDFNRADSTSLGGNWSAYGNAYALRITSNAVTYQSGSYNGARWNANTFSGNQFAQLTLTTLPSNDYAPGPCIRAANADANYEGYFIAVRSDGFWRMYRNGATIYDPGTAGHWSNGDVMRIEDRGSGVIVVMKNGADFYTGYTDGTPLTGTYIGIQGSAFWAGSTLFVVDDFSGGDLAGAASPLPLFMAHYS